MEVQIRKKGKKEEEDEEVEEEEAVFFLFPADAKMFVGINFGGGWDPRSSILGRSTDLDSRLSPSPSKLCKETIKIVECIWP